MDEFRPNSGSIKIEKSSPSPSKSARVLSDTDMLCITVKNIWYDSLTCKSKICEYCGSKDLLFWKGSEYFWIAFESKVVYPRCDPTLSATRRHFADLLERPCVSTGPIAFNNSAVLLAVHWASILSILLPSSHYLLRSKVWYSSVGRQPHEGLRRYLVCIHAINSFQCVDLFKKSSAMPVEPGNSCGVLFELNQIDVFRAKFPLISAIQYRIMQAPDRDRYRSYRYNTSWYYVCIYYIYFICYKLIYYIYIY